MRGSGAAADPGFDMAAFARAYAIMGAQRATKVLGIFARLDRRDGKPQYLKHLPRIEAYLARNLAHPALSRACGLVREAPAAPRADGWLNDPTHPVEPPDAGPLAIHDRHGARRRARQAHAADHGHDPEAARAGRRTDADRPRARPALRRRHRDRGGQRPSPRRPDRGASSGTPARPAIVVSDERDELLETGGGVKKALPLLGDGGDFLVLNSDSFWIEGPQSNLGRMIAHWEPSVMDILLLLASATTSFGYEGLGDFAMDAEGRLRRRREREVTPFVYAGVAIVKPELFARHARRRLLAQPPVRPRERSRPALRLAPRRPVASRRNPGVAQRCGRAHRRERALTRCQPRARVFTIPARRPLPADAGRRAARRPALSATQRSTPPRCRCHDLSADPPGGAGLRRDLAARNGGRAQLLPRIVPLGDADEAEFDLAAGALESAFEATAALAPPIAPLERRLILTRLVQRWSAEVEPRPSRGCLPACRSWCRRRPPTP